MTFFHTLQTSIGKRPLLATLAGVSALMAVGCGEDPRAASDVQQVAGDVRAAARQPDAAASISFETFTDDVSMRAATTTRALIRSAAGYQSFFGHAPPPTVDFARDWVMFYAAGTEPTGGYAATFVAVLRAGSSLIAITQLVSPGPECPVTQVLTSPYALIKFPAEPGASAQFYKNNTDRDCDADFCAAKLCAPGMTCDPATGNCLCGPVCEIYCEYGNVKDANGCPTCACNPPPTDRVSCGGFAGKPCPGFGKCGDDPNDSCDPAAGGADCPGICSCVQNVFCTADSRFDSSPAVCACVPLM